jgi:hypothetical protein
MTAFAIYEKISNAYETSTPANNKFAKAIQSIKWEKTFEADGEFYFFTKGLTFTTPSLDPFNLDWKPSFLFANGTLMGI